jgi:hypothetical protein
MSSYEIKPLIEQKIRFVAKLNEISPGTFLLYFKGSDTLSTIVFFIMNTLMWTFLLYTITLTVIKLNYK